MKIRTFDGRLVATINGIKPLKTVTFKCSKHGEVQGYPDSNGNVYCPECIYNLPSINLEHVNKVSEFHVRFAMKTRANVEKLKIQWLADPCWCLEKTEGFEEYEEELKEFADSKRKEWKEQDDLLSLKMAEQFGIYLCDNSNSTLTQVIPSKFGKMMRCLLDRLDRLEREVESLHYTGDE